MCVFENLVILLFNILRSSNLEESSVWLLMCKMFITCYSVTHLRCSIYMYDSTYYMYACGVVRYCRGTTRLKRKRLVQR